jgi:hypothetical protein
MWSRRAWNLELYLISPPTSINISDSITTVFVSLCSAKLVLILLPTSCYESVYHRRSVAN